jgi:hypothetical protein
MAAVRALLTLRQEGHVHDSFRSALYARGMTHDDGHLIATLMEIVAVEVSVDSIRRHFARILVHSVPQDAQALFLQFADDMCDGDSADAAVVRAALGAIEVFMLEMGRTLTHADYGFVLADLPDARDDAGVRRVRRRLPSVLCIASSIVERDRLVAMLNLEQRSGYDTVMAAIGSQRDCNVFAVLSSAGCGKTVFANAVAATVRALGRIAICVAASALAAMLLLGGTTAHSRFHIPIPANDGTICCFSSDDKDLIRSADVILYDECSMVHRDVADTLDRSLRDLMGEPRPFGGKVVVFMGDFKQLLPVVRYGRGQEHTMQVCSWWRYVTLLKFSQNWRAVRDPVFAAFLESVGSGSLADVVVPDTSRVADVEGLISDVYDDASTIMKHQIRTRVFTSLTWRWVL